LQTPFWILGNEGRGIANRGPLPSSCLHNNSISADINAALASILNKQGTGQSAVGAIESNFPISRAG